MRKCKDCKHWKQDESTVEFYNKNFGECTHKRVEDLENINTNYGNKENEVLNNYDLIYSADCFELAELKVNKEFGCKNFEER